MSESGDEAKNSDKSHVEAWKSVIDFTKTTVSIATAILTAIIGYSILNGIGSFNKPFIYISLILLLLAIILSLYGFGRAIKAVKSGNSQSNALLFANIGFAVLIMAIISLTQLKLINHYSVDYVLGHITQNTTKYKYSLIPNNCTQIVMGEDKYNLTYEVKDRIVKVVYSVSKNKILSIKQKGLMTNAIKTKNHTNKKLIHRRRSVHCFIN